MVFSSCNIEDMGTALVTVSKIVSRRKHSFQAPGWLYLLATVADLSDEVDSDYGL